MFNHLIEVLENAQNYVSAIQRGFDNFANTLPHMVKQHMNVISKQKLNSTQDVFMSAVSTKMINHVLVVELDRDNWLANAVETGADPFSMKDGHLKSPKAKTSKEGYKYMRIPIGVSKTKTPGTDSGKEFQKRIMEVLQKPKFGIQKLKMKLDGSVSVMQEVMTNSSELGGLYRIQEFKDVESFRAKKRPFKSEFILFRTISNNPKSMSLWNHPGIKPANIFRDTEKWLESSIDALLDQMIEIELERSGFK